MKKWIQLSLFFLALQATAQKHTLGIKSQLYAGLLEGEAGSAFQLQSINGVGYEGWSAGIGAGLDYYYLRSIPVFFDLRKNFGAAQKAPFVYADAGYNFPWLKGTNTDWSYQKAKGGLYYDAGIGYQLPVLKKSMLLFSAGYSQKIHSVTTAYPVAVDVYLPQPAQNYTIENVLRRISIKTGLRF